MGRHSGIQYRPGSWYRQDDRSGFTRRAESTKKEWTGEIVGEDLWEARQPQDFVRSVPDRQSVPSARPIPPNVFVGPFSSEIALDAAPGATIIYLRGVEGMTIGDPIGVMMANGEYWRTYITAIDYVNDAIHLLTAVPSPVAAGTPSLPNVVTDFLEPHQDFSGLDITTESGQTITTGGGAPLVTEG